MPQPPDETPDRNRGEKPAKQQQPVNEGGESEREEEKAIREAREKAELLSTEETAAAVISTGLLPH